MEVTSVTVTVPGTDPPFEALGLPKCPEVRVTLKSMPLEELAVGLPALPEGMELMDRPPET